MSIWTKHFWRATAERAISTAAQTAVGIVGADGLGILDVDWQQTGSVAGMAALVAVLKALAASRVGDGGPGFTRAEHVTGPDDYEARHGKA